MCQGQQRFQRKRSLPVARWLSILRFADQVLGPPPVEPSPPAPPPCVIPPFWAWLGSTYNKVATVKALLDAGYVVITPNALKPAGFWDTNQPPYNTGDLSR